MSKFFVLIIRAYQLVVSPLFPPSCRFVPSCSQYAIEAIVRYGAVRGVYVALKRVLRCHPFHPGGFDPLDRNSICNNRPAGKSSRL